MIGLCVELKTSVGEVGNTLFEVIKCHLLLGVRLEQDVRFSSRYLPDRLCLGAKQAGLLDEFDEHGGLEIVMVHRVTESAIVFKESFQSLLIFMA